MVKLRCKCLNVTIEIIGNSEREVNGSMFCDNVVNSDGFFSNKLYEVQLAVAGIRKEVDFLMRSRLVKDWVIYTCLGCNTELYATHAVKGDQRLLVTTQVLQNPEEILLLAKSKDLSPAFKIILKSLNEESLDTTNQYSNDTINNSSSHVLEHVKRFLNNEKELMEARIQEFTLKERNAFTVVQTRAFNDKKAILSVLRQAAESKVEECLTDAIDDVSENEILTTNDNKTIQGFASSAVTNIEIVRPSSTPSNITSVTKKRKSKGDVDNEDHFDPMFPNEQDFPAFPDSDEEDSSDNSFNQKEEYGRSILSPLNEDNHSKYSSSVPMNVPFMRKPQHVCYNTQNSHEGDSLEVPSPDKMAESIQALARSVQDSRTIFGDLPRPRVNTLPINYS